jgi:magnesium chelatase family protein
MPQPVDDGSPGAGKTLLARSMPSILPNLTIEEALEVTRIYSVNDMLPTDSPLARHRPFRTPHHTISHAGLVGGGRWHRPAKYRSRIAAPCSSTNCRSSIRAILR